MRRPARMSLAAILLLGIPPLAAAPNEPTPSPPLASPSSPSAPAPAQIVTTLLGEVSRGAVGGREFLTLRVDRPVGPVACRGDVLRVDTLELGDPARRERIETAALSAMLVDQAVLVTVPLDAARCADGKPTFTDVRSLPVWP